MLPGCCSKTQEDFWLGTEAQQPGPKDGYLYPVSTAEAQAGLLPPTGGSWGILATPKKVLLSFPYTAIDNVVVIDRKLLAT